MKPLPKITPWNKSFFDACKSGRFIAQKCRVTNQVWTPPSPISPYSRTPDWEWVELSGRGEVLTHVSIHQRYFDSFVHELPYVVALIRLDEGALFISNIRGASQDSIAAGERVSVEFETRGELAIPIFKQVQKGKAAQ